MNTGKGDGKAKGRVLRVHCPIRVTTITNESAVNE
jgi:hypothetical protein